MMVVNISPDLEPVIVEQARQQGIDPAVLVLTVLRERFLGIPPIVPRDEWERQLLGIARNCGVALSNEALSSEVLYE